MTIQYASDLHLEFPENRKFIKDNPLSPVGDILILAGDIVPFVQLDQHQEFFNYVSDHFQSTWWIPGNHEYYHGNIDGESGAMCESIRPNVHLVNNFSVIQGVVRFILSTLWSNIRPVNQWHIWKGLNDFRLISNGSSKLSVDDYNLLHQDALDFLSQELHIPFEGRTIVTTHHVPTLFHYPEKYLHDKLNEAFAVELEELIFETQPDYWIFGHHHYNQDPFALGKTTFLTNQVGYVQCEEHLLFAYDKIITI